MHTVHRTCSLCEAMCGLSFDVEENRIVDVRPDEEDVFSHGFLCPKGAAIAAVHDDPDRLRTPMRRTPGGTFEPISWDDAFEITASRLRAIRTEHGGDAIAVYIGNPIVHNYGALALRAGLLKALGTKNATSAGSQDTAPRFAASWHLYGSSFSIPVPDIDRTDYFLCIGANPYVSNGSFLTAPDIRNRMRAIRARGGKVVIVDPRRTETARDASEHVAIRPGGDAAFLLSLVQVLVARERVDRDSIAKLASGWGVIERRLEAFAPERVTAQTGVPVETIERLALELVDAPSGAVYTRVGVCNNEFGTLASWATDVLNLAAGRLGAAGGSMLPSPAMDVTPILEMTNGDGHARWKSRVRGLPETLGDLPASILAEEMETPGPGQVRAFVTFAGNPVLSTPNGRRLAAALSGLDFMVSIDLYVNETTRHADVILPPAWGLADDHADLVFSGVAVRNVARWSPPVVARGADEKADWEILLELTRRLGGGPTGVAWMDGLYTLGRPLGIRWTPQSTLDLLLRIGRYGDRFLPWSSGLNLERLKAAPHGIDLGPLEPGVAHRIRHRDGKIHLAAPPLVAAMDECAQGLERSKTEDEALLLIGRRELRTCNSWLHNVPAMVAGRERCVLYVHPEDAAKAGVRDGDEAVLESRVHTGRLRVHVTDEIRPGVVSLPHGWGHAESAPWQRVAGAHPGVSANDWTDDQWTESVVGQSILNGVPVRLHPAEPGQLAAVS
ncbi:MAG: molybdopterin oxidoreductase family protein [Deltaproteobacteria bacterium]|nr:molybdopterin oxidoreductase family protein [Deltaproteobacteria bacterium]